MTECIFLPILIILHGVLKSSAKSLVQRRRDWRGQPTLGALTSLGCCTQPLPDLNHARNRELSAAAGCTNAYWPRILTVRVQIVELQRDLLAAEAGEWL